MRPISAQLNFKARINYLLFDRFNASEKELRKFHFGTQMGLLGGMLLCLLESFISNIPILGYFGLTGILYGLVLLIVFHFIKKVKYLLLVKELGLELIVFFMFIIWEEFAYAG